MFGWKPIVLYAHLSAAIVSVSVRNLKSKEELVFHSHTNPEITVLLIGTGLYVLHHGLGDGVG